MALKFVGLFGSNVELNISGFCGFMNAFIYYLFVNILFIFVNFFILWLDFIYFVFLN